MSEVISSYVVAEEAPQTIPHNADAEQAVIGSVLINPEMYYEIARITQAIHFFIHRNRWTWEAFEKLAEKKMPIDMMTVSDEIARSGRGEDVSFSYLTSLLGTVGSSLNAVSYAYIVREYYERRRGISIANSIAANSYDVTKPFELSQQAGIILSETKGIGNRVDAKTAASEMIDLMEKSEFCTTTISDIDERLGGLFPAELSILAGYAGTGKSAMKQQIARRNAESEKRVLLCDLEMTAAQTWFRMACGDLGYDMNHVRSGRISQESRSKIIEYAAELGEKYQDRITIYEAPMNPSDILSAVMIERPDIVMVDVLKNVSGKDPRGNIRDWYDYVLNFLRLNICLSKDAGRPHLMVLHHLSREAKKINRKPTKEDLMFAGESDADGVHILWRKEKEEEGMKADATVVPVTWITEKSRFGWIGDSEINFNLPKQAFYGMSRLDVK